MAFTRIPGLGPDRACPRTPPDGYFKHVTTAAAKGLAVAEQVGDQENIAVAHTCVGSVALEMGRLDVAQREFHESGRIYHQLGNKEGEATATAWAGRAYKNAGQAERAVRSFLIAVQLSSELGETNDVIDSLRHMAPLLDKISREQAAPGCATGRQAYRAARPEPGLTWPYGSVSHPVGGTGEASKPHRQASTPAPVMPLAGGSERGPTRNCDAERPATTAQAIR
jgi:hypothetical protein